MKKSMMIVMLISLFSVNLLPVFAYAETEENLVELQSESTELDREKSVISIETDQFGSNNEVKITDEMLPIENSEKLTRDTEAKLDLPEVKSWLEEELEDNEVFIKAVETAVKKDRSVITVDDLQKIKVLTARGASSIPEKISDFTSLEYLNIYGGTVSEFPESIYKLRNTLQGMDIRNNHFVLLPEGILDTNWPNAGTAGKQLNIVITDNQIVTDIPKDHPQKGMFAFNSGHNLLEHYNYTDYHSSFQDQLVYKGGAPTLRVPLGYDFNQHEPSLENLVLYDTQNSKYKELFQGHEFEFYDDGSSQRIMTNGATTNVGTGSIFVKSKFSTPTNRFAKTSVRVIVEQGSSVAVHYQDDAGNELEPTVELRGLVGESYQSEQRSIEGYTFKEVEGLPEGNFAINPQEVHYIYTKDPVKAGDVSVYYEIVDGTPLVPVETLSGNIGDTYQSEERVFEGYSLKEVKGSTSGQFVEAPQEVRYIYTKDPVKAGDVSVYYEIVDGTPLVPVETLSGNIGDTYQSEERVFEGYSLKEVKGSASGQFVEDAQEVRYIYIKNLIIAGVVTVRYQDENGHPLSHDLVLSGKVGESYQSYPREISGYRSMGVQGHSAGNFTTETQTVIYQYKKISGNQVDPLTPPLIKPTLKDSQNTLVVRPNQPSEATSKVNKSAKGIKRLPQTDEKSKQIFLICGALFIVVSFAGFHFFISRNDFTK